MTFVFPDNDTLFLAITSGAVPSNVSLGPVRIGRDERNQIWLAPAVAIPESMPHALRRIGVELADSLPAGGDDRAHWLEALPLVRDTRPEPLTDRTPVLFEIGAAELAEFAGEMLRLGNDRQSFRVLRRDSPHSRTAPTVLLRVLGPPYFSMLQAIDKSQPTAPRAFLERVPGIWIEHGWSHPLADQLRTPKGQMILLRTNRPWEHLDAGKFRDVYETLDLGAQPDTIVGNESLRREPLPIRLRLVAGNTTDAPELWVLPPQGVEALDRFVREASPRALSRLAFAVAEADGRQVAVVRTRPGPDNIPSLPLEDTLAFRPFHRLPNLFVPCGSRLQPPLRREAVRGLLADDPDLVAWLLPHTDGAFVRQSMPESAFRPLGDWVEHVLDRDREALEAWSAATRCEFGSFVSRTEMVAAPHETDAAASIAAAANQSQGQQDELTAPTTPRPTRKRASVAAMPVDPLAATPATPGELQRALRAAEERFLDVEGPLDAPARQAIWPELGRLNGALGHAAESSLCWMHALWELPTPGEAAAWGWVQAERALSRRDLSAADLARLIANSNPTIADLRALAAVVVWAANQRPVPPALRAALPALQQYLDRHDRLLPVRGVWLTWYALSHHVGGDALALARVRDRLLDRLLTDGLSPERDLPGFLRFSGQQGGDRLRVVRERMERLRQLAHAWSGFRVDDSLQQTPAYFDLLFAFANARLGEAASAGALVARAAESLDGSGSDAHRFLLQAFQYRIDQVLTGRPHAGPLPTEHIEYLEQMRRDEANLPANDLRCRGSYVVERLREQSHILDPAEHFNPYRFNNRDRYSDALINELNRLPDVVDRRALTDRLRRLLQAVKSDSQGEIRLRVLTDALPLAARVGEALTNEALDQAVAVINAQTNASDLFVQERLTTLLERTVFFAAHFDRSELVPALLDRLESLLATPASAEAVLEARSRLVAQTLRGLRKLGLHDATHRVLEQLSNAILDGQSLDDVAKRDAPKRAETLRALLPLAGGWLSANQSNRARPILDAARAQILTGGQLISGNKAPLYVSLVCNYVSALARAPLDEALGRVEELFASGKMEPLPNTFTTNPYYSRFHLNIVEAVVLALANEEFAIGPAARRWLDDDEYLIRRRIHRDVRTALERP